MRSRRAQAIVLRARANGATDARASAAAEKLLMMCPDVLTAWNVRRSAVEANEGRGDGAETSGTTRDWWSEELRVSEGALRSSPKSYPSWYHRKWSVQRMIRTMGRDSSEVRETLEREAELCAKLLELDDRNFHCWAYRRFIVEALGRTMEEEMQYTLTKIEQNFSNYSAWHQRSAILDASGGADAATLRKEFELASNAFYTEPEDQSAWMYHRWLVSRARALPNQGERDAILTRALETCREVAELEPGCKWPLSAQAGLEDESSRRQIFDRLAALDGAREGYYRDVSSTL